ncbi:MAG: RHS repeat-associated core domain-containing protein [Thermoanaerobaculia bacterium]
MRVSAPALWLFLVFTLLFITPAPVAEGGVCPAVPEVRVEVTETDSVGNVKALFHYRNAQRINWSFMGHGGYQECQILNSCIWSEEWNVIELEFNVACKPPGTATLYVWANLCLGLPYMSTGSAEVDVQIPAHTAAVSQTLAQDGMFGSTTIDYKFTNAPYGSLLLELLPQDPFSGGPWVISSVTTPDAEGTRIEDLGRLPDAWRLLRVTATACGDVKATDSDATKENPSCELPTRGNPPQLLEWAPSPPGSDSGASCPTCVGDPVHVGNGAMRFIESDPLPGGLTRVYDSNKRDYSQSYFGKDWSTFLDAHVFTFDDADRRGTLVFDLGDRITRVFERRNGAYVRTWPESAGPAESVYFDGATGETVYRDATAGQEWRFRPSDGWLTSIVDMATGRATIITRIAAKGGHPQRVADSWGNWAWVITTDGRRLVTRLELEGDPSAAWVFNYGSEYDTYLYSIQGPGNALWRTYTYADVSGGRVLAEARDGSGNVLEGHDYDYTTRRALSSRGPSGEITGILYGLPGRVSGETVTEVSFANGRVERRYLRDVADVERAVQIDGGCSSCGGGSLTLAHDEKGRIWRRQDARGWITENDYGTRTDTAPLAVRSHLRPAGCDPSSSSGDCRLDPDQLAAETLVETPESSTVSYTYGDPGWPDRPTLISDESVLVPGEQKSESLVYATGTGQLLSRTLSGWTEEPATQASRVTTSAYYNGTAGAAFNPGGTFQSSWTALPQPRGVKKSVDGPRNDVNDETLFVYYPVDGTVPAALRGRLAAVRNAAGHVTRYESYDAFGNALRVVDANGVATESTYNGLGRLLTSTLKGVAGCSTSADPLCRNDLTTTRAYASTIGPLLSETRPGGGVTVYAYDGRGRVATVSRGPAANDLRERIEYAYEATTGKKSTERLLALEGGTWVEKKRESFSYDSFERLRRTTHPDATFVEYGYDAAGNLATVQDENHPLPNTRYEYDAASRLREVRQTLGGGEVVTRYEYDDEANLIRVTDPNGNVTAYLYDDFGQMLRQTSAVTGDTKYEYDAAGNLARTVDARGAVTTRGYDALGRVTQSLTTGEGSSETITWGYDAATFGIGRMTSMTDGLGTVSYTYDRRGLLLTETRPIEGVSYVTKYAYDANGNRTKLTYPSARAVDTAYDYAGRPVTASGKVGNKSTSYVAATSYLPFGPMTSMTSGNGLVKTMTYDTRYRLDRLTLGTVADYDYGYDNAGNITSIADLAGAAYNRSYGYDDLSRLTSAAGPWGAGNYGYDAMGNMESYAIGTRTGTFSYAGTTPKLTSVFEGGATVPVQYDAAGNELTGTRANGPGQPSEQRWYTPRNALHLVYLSASGTKSRPCVVGQSCPNAPSSDTYYEFGYDGRGVRTIERRRTGSTLATKHYAYSPELSLLGHKTPGNKGTGIEAIWFAGAPIAQEVWGTHGQTKWTFTDHLGTPLLQTNSSKAVVWRAEYEPYGNVYAMRSGTKDDQPLRFPGQERLFDGSTGTEERYNIFRWYRSGWGRYTQADPFGVLTDRNLYRYVYGNPVRKIDPLGLDTVGCDGVPDSWDTPCRLECCAAHDECFRKNSCSEGAWGFNKPKTRCDLGGPCQGCNDSVKRCWARCGPTRGDDPKKPNYYCGKLGRYVTIPGDYPDVATAMKACECDYSTGCTLPPLPPQPPTPPVIPGRTPWRSSPL